MRRAVRLMRVVALSVATFVAAEARAEVPVPVPPHMRGSLDAERSGFHDAANIRTVYWNFGMVGDYPINPGGADLSVFHSVEVPKGSGMNYSDGITPFVLTRIHTADGQDVTLMETGFRERQQQSPRLNRVMRFEPRPGYFEPNPSLNGARAPAISNDRRTWPSSWPDRLDDPDDPGWPGSWNGYFGKEPKSDQESFSVMDDDFYDAWQYYPDARDSSRHGLGLRVEVRGFQWKNPQAGNVIFWHYDIVNESTTNYDNMIFGLYMDSGVGGPKTSCDGIFESDDDNAFFDKASGLNLVYTWDRTGRGTDLAGNCSPTGYLGYAYLETPGNPFDGLDNDDDGITDERRDLGAGTHLVGQTAIRDYVNSQYDAVKFVRAYGELEKHPAYRLGDWWTGDEDMDWNREFDDVGADGVPQTGDTGEGDGKPTEGEPNFDRTDLNESDQIGLTGFKMNRIKAGAGNPNAETDGILFYTESLNWPSKLYQKFTDPFAPARFDSALASNYNIGFLFASGPFSLRAGQHERFSLALAYGADLAQLRSTVGTVQQIYNANYRFAVPPPMPTLSAEAGDGFVRLSWDDVAERGVDPVTNENDFEGYRIYRSTDPEFRDPQTITTGTGDDIGIRKPNKIFDLVDGRRGYSQKAVEGIHYYLGEDVGVTHTWTDNTVTNGQVYYYAVTAYDFGVESIYDSLRVFPSENPITVTRTPRGGLILPKNVVETHPNVRVLGLQGATTQAPVHVAGKGVGSANVTIVDADSLSEGHRFRIEFSAPAESIRATQYALVDSTTGAICFEHGADFEATGQGAVGCGLLPVISTIPNTRVWTDSTGFTPTSTTTTKLRAAYTSVQDINLRRTAFPADLRIEFDDQVRDTSIEFGFDAAKPAKFRVFAETASGDMQLDFIFRDSDNNQTLGPKTGIGDRIDVLVPVPGVTRPDSLVTWTISIAAGTVQLTPSKDNTLYEESSGALSNGAGSFFFAGTAASGEIRRGLVAFDVQDSVPAGAVITGATLRLHHAQTPSGAQTVNLRRVTADWGEGTSDASGGEDGGAPSTLGDATWIHRFFNTTLWTTVGGDFVGASSAAQAVSDTMFYSWNGPGVVADVQQWLDSPGSNFGWALRGNEAVDSTAKRFDSRQSASPGLRPVLTVDYRTTGTLPHLGDVWRLRLQLPLGDEDAFSFPVHGSRVDAAAAKAQFGAPYVVPNPYIEAASFEPARFNVSGRGERRMEFRSLPTGATVRIYTVRGELVQTLRHDGSQGGYVVWNMRTKDNLDVAPGLFVFQVDAPGIGTSIGKFAIIK